MEKHSFTYGNNQIEYFLLRKEVKNINLNVKPDLSILVSAADNVPFDYIHKFVKSRAHWIQKRVSYFSKALPEGHSVKEYISGESFKYLGKQYRLKVIPSQEEKVVFFRGFIHLYIKNRDNYSRKDKLIKEWYTARTHKIFLEVLNKVYPIIQKYNITKPTFEVRLMKARWGSCLKEKHTILLNSDLIKAPKYCIQYVILHELIHFIHTNHNKEFYDFQTALMPDWEVRKEILDLEVIRDL